jgi:hypothetical protein
MAASNELLGWKEMKQWVQLVEKPSSDRVALVKIKLDSLD